MKILWQNAVLSFIIFWFYLLDDCSFELNRRVTLISLEHPHVYEVNHELGRLLNITSRRPGRSDPTHYVHLWAEYYKPLDDTSGIIVNVYEFLSNEYRPSFVIMRFKFCDFVTEFLKTSKCYYTNNISIPVKPTTMKGCFLKPGIYYFPNLTLPMVNLPINFPFLKGRVYINHTYRSKLIMAGYIDIELKTVPLRKYKGRP